MIEKKKTTSQATGDQKARPTTQVMSDPTIHVVAPVAAHTPTVILLHDRGSNAIEFASKYFESQASDDCFLTQVFPSFSMCRSPVCARRRGRDASVVRHGVSDSQLPGMRESVRFMHEVIKKEAADIGGLNKVFLGGISQGCATATMAFLTGRERMAGFIGYSGWCPFDNDVLNKVLDQAGDKQAFARWVQEKLLLSPTAEASLEVLNVDAALQTRILTEHAQDDPVVPLPLGRNLRDKLRRLGATVQWMEYEERDHCINEPHWANEPHWINEPDRIGDMIRFIKVKVME
jgi:lysophospholipase-2